MTYHTLTIKCWFVFITILLCCVTAMAQLKTYKYITYTTDNALADNSVTEICADKTGALWIATRNGLSHYDGTTFKSYYQSVFNGCLRSNWVTSVAMDSSGTVWVSTEWGLCYYNKAEDKFMYVNNKKSIQVLYKSPLLCTGNNTLWIAAEDGLYRINTVTKNYTATSLTRIPDPQSMVADKQGNIWISTRGNGIFIYDAKANFYRHIFPAILPHDAHIMDLFADGDAIWAATSEGLLRIDGELNAKLFFTNKENPLARCNELMCVTSFVPLTSDSMLLCGTYNKKLLLFNKNKKLFTSEVINTGNNLYEIPNGIFYRLYPVRNILWMATDAGLCKLNIAQQNCNTFSLPLQCCHTDGKVFIKNIIADDINPAVCWMIAQNPGRLLKVNIATGSVLKSISSQDNDTVYKKLLRVNGSWWVVKEHGISQYTHEGLLLKTYHSHETFYNGTFDHNHTLWLGTESGIAALHTVSGKWQLFKHSFSGTPVENQSFTQSFPVSGLLADNKNRIWIACIKYGLFCFDIATQKFTAYRHLSGDAYDAKNRCSSLSMDSNGRLWLGTMSGISSFDTAAKTFVNYNRADGLLSTYVYSISTSAEGNVWGRGNTGVFCLIPSRKKFINYKIPVALSPDFINQTVSVTAVKTVVGFEGGFATFTLPISADSTAGEPVYITGASASGKRLPAAFDGTIQLTKAQDMISISYAAVDYSDEPVAYEYKLEGMNEDWRDVASQQTVLFPALPPGSYVFKVRRKSGTIKENKTASLAITVKEPYWQSTQLRLLVLAVIIVAAAGIVYLRVKKIKHRGQQNAATAKAHAELEMKALRSQMNPHFIFNSLSSIQKFIWESRQEDASEYLAKFARLIRMVLENSQHKLVPLKEELKALRLYLELEQQRTGCKFDYTINTGCNTDENTLLLPPLLLQPYAENAIWHGLSKKEDRGYLLINVYKEDDILYCVIDDNGIGRTMAATAYTSLYKQVSLGTNISSARVKWLYENRDTTSSVQIIDKRENGAACGTTVIIQLPVIEQHDEMPNYR